MADENNEHGQFRQPKDVRGLLKFCMEATRSEDASGRTEFQEMSDERKKWLEEALTQMTVSPAERMSLCIESIMTAEQDTEQGTEAQVTAVTELQDWAEDLDIAKDFVKMNGLRILPRLLSSAVSELRWRCLELMGTLSQNNPFVQKTLLDMELMPVFLTMVDQDDNSTVRVKALYAVSCLVRGHHDGQSAFVSAGGLSELVRILAKGDNRLTIKAVFLMSALCADNPAYRDTLTRNGAVSLLVKLLQETDHDNNHEHIMSALVGLVRDNASAQAACLDPAIDFKTFLCQRMLFLAGKEEFMEEREHADRLLTILNSEPQQQGTSLQASRNNAVAILSLTETEHNS